MTDRSLLNDRSVTRIRPALPDRSQFAVEVSQTDSQHPGRFLPVAVGEVQHMTDVRLFILLQCQHPGLRQWNRRCRPLRSDEPSGVPDAAVRTAFSTICFNWRTLPGYGFRDRRSRASELMSLTVLPYFSLASLKRVMGQQGDVRHTFPKGRNMDLCRN